MIFKFFDPYKIEWFWFAPASLLLHTVVHCMLKVSVPAGIIIYLETDNNHLVPDEANMVDDTFLQTHI